MTDGAAQWCSYDEAAALLGLSPEALKRLALRCRWPRRPGPSGAEVAVPEVLPTEAFGLRGEDSEGWRGGARTLLDYLEAHVERLTEELAEVRTEMRGVRYEAESLRVEAGRAQVFMALVEAERARSAEIRAERDRLAAELAERRQGWLLRVMRAFQECRPQRRRAFRASECDASSARDGEGATSER